MDAMLSLGGVPRRRRRRRILLLVDIPNRTPAAPAVLAFHHMARP
jgi:hypothetical protein